MDWDDLRLVLVVARSGSVAAAARELGVAHTTVYRRLAAIEATLGVRLLDRDGGAVVPTDAGRALLEAAGDVEERVLAVRRALSGQDRELRGDVTVATVEPLAVELADHLLALRRVHPAIHVQLHVTDAFVDLARREADLALRATREPAPDLVGRKVATLAFAVYGTAEAGEGWVCFDGSRADSPQGRWEAANVPPDRVVFRTSSRAVFLRVVTSGGAIGVLPCGLAAGLVRRSAPIAELALPLWLLAHRDVARIPRIRAVAEALGDALERDRRRLEG